MTGPAWDLDAPLDRGPVTGRSRSGVVLALAVGLAGLGLGGLVGSALEPTAAGHSPVAATLSVRELYLDTTVRAATGPVAAIPTIVLRLLVDNPATGSVRLTALVLDGVTREPIELPLNVPVAGHRTATVDVTVHPDCARNRKLVALRARLRLTRIDGSAREAVWVAPSRTLNRTGGLCSQLDTELPNGWRTPLTANNTRLAGDDLEIIIGGLPSRQLAGIRVDDQLLPTVFVGDQLISAAVQLEPGALTRLRLRGPPPCIPFGDNAPIPTTLRLLAEGEEGVQQRLLVVGPPLTRWLRPGCRP